MKNKTKEIIYHSIWFIGAIWTMWLTVNGAVFLTKEFNFIKQFPSITMILTGAYLLYFHFEKIKSLGG